MASLPAATEEGDREEQLRWLELQGATWSNREDASAAMVNFVTLAQHRHVLYDDTKSNGRCASFKCPDCKMDIRSRMRLNGDWKLETVRKNTRTVLAERNHGHPSLQPSQVSLPALWRRDTLFLVRCYLCPRLFIFSHSNH